MLAALEDLKANTKRLGPILTLMDEGGQCPILIPSSSDNSGSFDRKATLRRESESIAEFQKIFKKQQEEICILKGKVKFCEVERKKVEEQLLNGQQQFEFEAKQNASLLDMVADE